MLWLPKYKVGADESGKPVYKESSIWWYRFTFQGRVIKESSGCRLKTEAGECEKRRRDNLERQLAGTDKPKKAPFFSVAADEYLASKEDHLTAGSVLIERNCIKHLNSFFGEKLVISIQPSDFNAYRKQRRTEITVRKRPPANSTLNLELAVFSSILRHVGAWPRFEGKIKLLPEDEVGKCLRPEEEERLLAACSQSRQKCLLPYVLLLIETGSRRSTARKLQWVDVDFDERTVTMGRDKTKAGSGRVVPLSPRAYETLKFWAQQFPARQPEHYVFPHQCSGVYGDTDKPITFDVTRPFVDIAYAWEVAQKRAGVKLRFHDCRHTASSRMQAAGVPLTKIGKILGWSPSTVVAMSVKYGHFTTDELRSAVASIERTSKALPPTDREQITKSPATLTN